MTCNEHGYVDASATCRMAESRQRRLTPGESGHQVGAARQQSARCPAVHARLGCRGGNLDCDLGKVCDVGPET